MIDRLLFLASSFAVLCVYSLYSDEHHPWIIISLVALWFLTACRNLNNSIRVSGQQSSGHSESQEANPLEP